MVLTEWQPVIDYLKHESDFQAAAAAVTAAAAAWLLKEILAPSTDTRPLTHPCAARLAAGSLAVASFLFLVQQGRLSKMYGQLAQIVAGGDEPCGEWQELLVREVWDSSVVIAWAPYYGARALLLAEVAQLTP